MFKKASDGELLGGQPVAGGLPADRGEHLQEAERVRGWRTRETQRTSTKDKLGFPLNTQTQLVCSKNETSSIKHPLTKKHTTATEQ